ncbi:MAG: NADH-ubiquinone oxidoreductase-F iron-sulfur binding region domain-containing protein [Parcubacteria group bacterium]
MDLLKKIKENDLKGRGGAGFSVYDKWKLILKTKTKEKYFIVNGAEGEPGVKKDEYIIKHHLEELLSGIKLIINYIKTKKCIIFLNHDFLKYGEKIKADLVNTEIEIIYKNKNHGYIAGEESTMLNILEGKRSEPRARPPFPTESGYNNSPTLIHNIETIYNIYLVSKSNYKKTRFYTINGEVKNPGVYNLPANYSIARILEETNNLPSFKFFVQHGGQASGEILNSSQLKKQVSGCGAITIYSYKNNSDFEFIKNLVNFYFNSSCGKCTPCREGTYRLKEMLSGEKMNWSHFLDLIDNLENSSFCALGSSLAVPVKSYINNVNPDFKPEL